jgi:hypothetical protein
LLRRCALFATGREPNEVASNRRDGNIDTARVRGEADFARTRMSPRQKSGLKQAIPLGLMPRTGQPAKSPICLIVHAIDR